MSAALGYMPFTLGSEGGGSKRESERESGRAEFTVIELSVFCCVTAPGFATEIKHKKKNVIFYDRPLLFISFFHSECCCAYQKGSYGVNKIDARGPGA